MSGESITARSSEWARREAQILEALAALRELAGDHHDHTGDALGPIDVLRGTQGVWQAFWLYADLASSPVIDAVVPDLRPLADVLGGSNRDEWSELGDLLRAGRVTIRLILSPAATTSRPERALVDELVAAGVEARIDVDPAWFFVSHGRVAVAPLEWARHDEAEVAVVPDGPFLRALTDLFALRWATARPWGAPEYDGVLALLGEGLTDEDVATRLGVSVRTVRRRVADAMAAHGAATRFELAWRHAGR